MTDLQTHPNLKQCKFRYAGIDDLDELMPLYDQFFDEASYKDFITFDPGRARQTVHNGIVTCLRPHILAIIADKIIGFVSWELDWSFSVRPVGVLYEIYVVPEHRRSAIGRYLAGLSVWAARDSGACAYHAPIASGMKEARSLANLYRRMGFTELGTILRKQL